MKLSEKVRMKMKEPFLQAFLRISYQQLMIAFGTILASFAYVLFQLPYNLAAGGVSGLGVIINHLTGFSPGIFFLIANIPLFILGFFTLGGFRFLFSSTLAVLTFSAATEFFMQSMPAVLGNAPITEDKLLATVFTGLIGGIGSGIVYRFGGTMGGTTIPARIINNKTGFPLSQSALYVDVGIILLAGIVFSWENALLAFLAMLIFGMAADFALEGPSQMRTLMIITSSPEPIRHAIVHELGRGVSMWKIEGGYERKERTMIYCTVLRSRIYDVKFIVNKLDPNAFMVVGVSQQTWGGHKSVRRKPKKAIQA